MEVELTGLNRTLLMPLWGRAKATAAGSRILRDPAAVGLAERLGLWQQGFDRSLHPSNELFTIARARALDDIVREYLSRNPQATVANLGAGLDTGFDRVDNGQVRWLSIDLPEVIELRSRLIPESPRSRCVAASILEDGWLEPVTAGANGLLFLASGVMAQRAPAPYGEGARSSRTGRESAP
jgi:O-methyltransferase involved in polyketide biosynthesis